MVKIAVKSYFVLPKTGSWFWNEFQFQNSNGFNILKLSQDEDQGVEGHMSK
uniref:Uncharacterized protein n=1 Tax=Rhizophora mucronata TaxID=61149 RepID=A0A2P2NB94_RHIMU